MPKYRWINYTGIKGSLPIKSFNRLFMGESNQIHTGVAFYCDRTNPESNIVIPNHLQLPVVKREFLDWDQITEIKCRELETLLQTGRRCLILWSGGIDSTYIISSLIEQIDHGLLDNITIGLSASSIFENPYFYRDQILPRFKNVQDIEHSTVSPGTLTISGDQGDKILCPEIMIQWLYEHPGKQELNLSCDKLLTYLSRYNQCREKSKELYESVLESAKRSNLELITASDFLWWLGFNYMFVGMFYSGWARDDKQDLALADIEENTFYWFCDARWQSWSMNVSGRWLTVDDEWHREYKKYAKQTIYRIDGNIQYLKWKQKILSTTTLKNRWKNRNPYEWVLAVDADGIKHYTNNTRLSTDLVKLGIDP